MLSSEETRKMQTNEALVEALQREGEGEWQGLVRRLAELEGREEARLKEWEREGLQAIFRVGRRWLGVVLAWRTGGRRTKRRPPIATARVASGSGWWAGGRSGC